MADNEKPKAEKSKKGYRDIHVRVDANLFEEYKKTHPRGTTATFVGFMQDKIKESGGKIEDDTVFERLMEKVQSSRRELDSLERTLNSKFEQVNAVAQRNMPLTLENVDQIIKELLMYQVKSQDEFSERNKSNFIDWLYAWKKNENNERSLAKARAEKYGVTIPEPIKPITTVPERYISKEDRCNCGICLGKFTLEEHNARCMAKIRQMEQHNREVHNDPLNMIRMITTSKYGWMYVDKEQKQILDAYLKEHSLPFPRFKGKHVPLEFAVFNSRYAYDISRAAQRILDAEQSNEEEQEETESE